MRGNRADVRNPRQELWCKDSNMIPTPDTCHKADSKPRSISAAMRFGIGHLLHLIPEGRPLPSAVWESRHRGIVIALWLHALALACTSVFIGLGLGTCLLEASPIVGAALLAGWRMRSREFRTVVASLGLVSASVALMHL